MSISNSLSEILLAIGLRGLDDYVNIIPEDAFDKLDSKLVQSLLSDYKLQRGVSSEVLSRELSKVLSRELNVELLSKVNMEVTHELTTEQKFEAVNRVLELKFGLIIDSIKDVDSLPVRGFKLEMLPGV